MIGLVAVALAAPELEAEPLDPLEACVEAAGPVTELGSVTPSDRIALIVGVPCHETPTPALQFSSRDAARVETVLAERGFQTVRLSTLVNRDAFLRALDAVDEALAPDGELVVYFSGHGVLREDAGALARYLVFSDSHLDTVDQTGLRVDDLEQRVATIDAARRTVVQDTCFAASTEAGGKGLGGGQGAKGLVLTTPSLAEVDLRLYASRFYEIAVEDPDRQGSVYTSLWLDALGGTDADLDGDGCVGMLEAHALAATETARARNGYQNPQWAGRPRRDACPQEPTRAVLYQPAGSLEAVEPGPIGDSESWTAQAGEWVDLSAPPTRPRPEFLFAVVPEARVSSTRPSLGLGAEVATTVPVGRVRSLLGIRGAWSTPQPVGDVCFRSTELVARAGVLAGEQVRFGPVVELGALARRAIDACETPADVAQLATLGGARFRLDAALGPVLGVLETGVSGVPVERGSLRLSLEPTVALGVGLRL